MNLIEKKIRSTMSKLLVTLVHLSYNDLQMEVKLSDYLNSQPSITVLSASTTNEPAINEDNKYRYINPSDSIIQTVLTIITKRDLINEQSSKYLIQYFQFFNMYASIGIQQVLDA
jgi:hypothetical protein